VKDGMRHLQNLFQNVKKALSAGMLAEFQFQEQAMFACKKLAEAAALLKMARQFQADGMVLELATTTAIAAGAMTELLCAL